MEQNIFVDILRQECKRGVLSPMYDSVPLGVTLCLARRSVGGPGCPTIPWQTGLGKQTKGDGY